MWRRACGLLVILAGGLRLLSPARTRQLELARGNGRRRELAVRSALGRSGRLAAQLLTESVVPRLPAVRASACGILGSICACDRAERSRESRSRIGPARRGCGALISTAALLFGYPALKGTAGASSSAESRGRRARSNRRAQRADHFPPLPPPSHAAIAPGSSAPDDASFARLRAWILDHGERW